MKNKANNDIERLVYKNMHDQFKIYENNLLILTRLGWQFCLKYASLIHNQK